jgi:two-component system, NtrC family, sensor kinase
MTLKARVVAIMAIVICGYAAMQYAIQLFVVYPQFVSQEQISARSQLQRCRETLELELERLRASAESFATSEKLSSVIQNQSQESGLAEFFSSRLRTAGPDAVYIYDSGKNLLWSKTEQHPVYGAVKTARLHSAISKKENGLFAIKKGTSNKGFISTDYGPMLLVVSNIATSSQSHRSQGTIVLARYLTDDLVRTLEERVGIDFSFSAVNDASIGTERKDIINQMISAGTKFHSYQLSGGMLKCSLLIEDAANWPIVLLESAIRSDISSNGTKAIHQSIILTLVAGGVIALILVILIQCSIISPIAKLIHYVKKVGNYVHQQGQPSRFYKSELSILKSEFEYMLERINNSQKDLLEQSYVSGMAEMSSAVLHNARNSLSPVVNGVEQLQRQFKELPTDKFEIIQQELKEESISENRREDLTKYVCLVSGSMVEMSQQTQSQLDNLVVQLGKFEEILCDQNTFRKSEKPMENVDLSELISDAVDMVPQKYRSQSTIEISPLVDKIGPITVQRVVILQVLHNLLINAAEAFSKHKPLCPKISVEANLEKADGQDRVHIRITDNGIGIEPEKLEKIFQRGFSTKKKGLTGIGLHWCANSISAMNGRIYAESRGRQRGTCFHVLLPKTQGQISLALEGEKESEA